MSSDSTFRMIVSLSIKIVFCISVTILSHKSSFSNTFSSSFNITLIPPPKALITSGSTLTLNPGLLTLSYFECKLPVIGSLFQSLLFYIVFLQTCHITYPYGFRLLLFKHQIWPSRCCRKLNSKSHTSFAWEFSKTCPLFHFSWYHFTFWSNRFCSFAYATAITISTLFLQIFTAS